MHPCIYEHQTKHNPATHHPRQNIREPFVVPGKFPCEPVDDEYQHESNRAGEKQQYPRDVVSGLVELAEIPSVRHQDQRRDAHLKDVFYFHCLMLNVYGSKREEAVIKSFR